MNNQFDRRKFLQLSSAALLTSTVHNLAGCAKTTKETTKPNIIFIMADDLGYGELGCYGQTKIKTPNIDSLANEGVRFTQHYSGSPVCAPSRCVLLTGKHTGHAYIRDNLGAPYRGQEPIPEETVTIAKLLKKAGYSTACIGKWGLGGPGTSGEPNIQGFDYFYGYLDQWNAHSHYPEFLFRNGSKELLEGNMEGDEPEILMEGNKDSNQQDYSQDLFVEDALKYIAEHDRSNPFFLYLPFAVPHVSLHVPEDSLAEYKDKWPETPYPGRHYQGHETPRAAYAAMITRMDEGIGKILDLLNELDLEENTVVIFTSDNGPTYAGGVDYEFFNSAGPLRGLKGSLYEGGIRVPFIARWKGKIEENSVCATISAFWDILPTFNEIAGVENPDDIDGISLVPSLNGGSDPQREHEYLYWEHLKRMQAVRKDNWKAVRQHPTDEIELYDLSNDISESKNVASDFPEIVTEMKKLMISAREESELFPLMTIKE